MQAVLVVGGSYSGEDISREVAGVASCVYLSSRSWTSEALVGTGKMPFGDKDNITRYGFGIAPLATLMSIIRGKGVPQLCQRAAGPLQGPTRIDPPCCRCGRHLLVQELTPDGFALFPDGQRLGPVHAVIYCTGYLYTFPFLMEAGGSGDISAAEPEEDKGGQSMPPLFPSVIDQRVGPLYLQMFPPGLGPSLSFVGLPWKAVPFPMQEMQAKLVARALSGRVQLPSPEDQMISVASFYERLHLEGVPMRSVRAVRP